MFTHKLICLLVVSLFTMPSIAKDMRESSERWACVFPVNTSGNKPTGNFFPCGITGCGDINSIRYKRPESYLKIINFIIDFKSKKVVYDWGYMMTTREIVQSKSKRDEKVHFIESNIAVNSVQNLTNNSGKSADTILTANFITPKTVLDDGVVQSINTLNFYAGGTKVLWTEVRLFAIEYKLIVSIAAFGQCEPL